MRPTIPTRLIRMMPQPAVRDAASRTISGVISTRKIASDGGILDPEGIDLSAYRANSVVLASHISDPFPNGRAPVIGRSVALTRDSAGVWSQTQFADTELGREWAYLYGLNDEGEVYMRAWSIGWDDRRVEWLTHAQARAWLGDDYDDDIANRFEAIWLAAESEMTEYSPVAIGADRDALSRAAGKKNIRTAAGILADLDLNQAAHDLATLRASQTEINSRIERLEKSIQALRRDGPAAATRGDSADIANQIHNLASEIRKGE